MKYLLDTHVAKWALDDAAKLSDSAKSIIADTSLHLCVSLVSAWEIAIKISVGKLSFFGGSAVFNGAMHAAGGNRFNSEQVNEFLLTDNRSSSNFPGDAEFTAQTA